jgi:NADH-quinone oxidoreductase subunit L
MVWMKTGGMTIGLGLALDDLARTMLIVVTGIGFIIHVYSLAYMKDDDGKSRFFASLSLFMFSMCGIVVSDNLIMTFLFWELVGVSSYLLIGHWFKKDSAADAANKAFLVNRIGDFGFMAGILLIGAIGGSFMFADLGTIGKGLTDAHGQWLLGVAILLLFCGVVGKSAQAPLHVWLPDAMEGPTPVSALIHAATMVAAGVYLLARLTMSGLLSDASPLWATDTIAWVGLITSVMAALMATQQDDIKRILAYSTLSQLGYMVMAAGLHAEHASMFHLYTHAFFKALLFLGTGAVIHSMHHEQDIWKMGGLFKRMPITAITFVIGTLALVGVPLFSGNFSKHEILAAAHDKSPVFFWATVFVAFLTTFYMCRLVFTVFFGKERTSSHAHEAPALMTVPLVILAVPSVVAAYPFFIDSFPYLRPHVGGEEAHHAMPAIIDIASLTAIGGGILLALSLYWNKPKDLIRIPLFARRFYIDDIYNKLVRIVQDGLASVSAWLDRWFIDGVLVRGTAATVWFSGFVLRFFQVGNVQAYSFLFGAGLVVLLYLLFNK